MAFIPRPRTIVSLICLAILTPTARADTPAREINDGVTHVKNGSTPTGGVQARRMNELWRVGGEDDEEILFGLTTKVCTDGRGRVYVLDSQLNRVLVFSPDGEFSHTLFREGEGPGEVRQPRDLFVLGDGRACVAPDRDAYAIHVFSADGRPELVIERDYEPIGRSDQEYEELRQTLVAGLSVVPIEFELSVERQAAAIPYFQRGLHLREDGSIWALSGRGIRDLPDGVFAVFDVFDRSGEFVRQMELHGPGNALKDGIFFDGDRILVVKGYMDSMMTWYGGGIRPTDDDEMESDIAVICYRLEK